MKKNKTKEISENLQKKLEDIKKKNPKEMTKEEIIAFGEKKIKKWKNIIKEIKSKKK